MFETVAAIIVAICLVLPGFIIADLAEARRAQPQARSDWELVLRALIYALLLQSAVLLTGWTTRLIDTAGLLRHAAHGMRPTWESHTAAIALWVLVVILIAPTVLGLMLGWFLRRAERHGNLTWFHYASVGATPATRGTTSSCATAPGSCLSTARAAATPLAAT